jgi:hypothetical protein
LKKIGKETNFEKTEKNNKKKTEKNKNRKRQKKTKTEKNRNFFEKIKLAKNLFSKFRSTGALPNFSI